MKWLILSLSILMAACAAQPGPQEAVAQLNREFQGHGADEFFLDFGQPAGSGMTADGKTYRWISLDPAMGSSGSNFIEPEAHYRLGEDGLSNGEMITGFCEARISVDKHERIRTIVIANDSIGKFSGSRCAEIFAAPSTPSR